MYRERMMDGGYEHEMSLERIGVMCGYENGNRCEEWVSLGGMRDRR